jgi:hypothetical protein
MKWRGIMFVKGELTYELDCQSNPEYFDEAIDKYFRRIIDSIKLE